MPKYYYVTLHNIVYKEGFRGQAMYVDKIIVEKRMNQVRELLTGYKVDVIPDSAIVNQFRVIDEAYHDKKIAEETGYHLAVLGADLNKGNLVSPKMIEDYVTEYECSNEGFPTVYEEIKSKIASDEKKKETVRQKAKRYKGTKK